MKKLILFLGLALFSPHGLWAQTSQTPTTNSLSFPYPSLISSSNFHRRAADSLLAMLIMAEIGDAYEVLVGDETIVLKDAYPRDQFETDSKFLKSRLKAGYQYDLLDELNQKGNKIYLYRLQFKDGGDDVLCRMSVKNDKIAGVSFN